MNFVKSSRIFCSMPQLDTPEKIQAEGKGSKKTKNTLKDSIYRSLKLFQSKETVRKRARNKETLEVMGARHLSDSLDYRQVKPSEDADPTKMGSTGIVNKLSDVDGEDEQHSLIYRPISYCSLPDLTEIDVSPRQTHLMRQRSRSLDCPNQRNETSELSTSSNSFRMSLRVHNIHHDLIPINEDASCSLPNLTDISRYDNEMDTDMDIPTSVYDWDGEQNQVKGTKSLVKRFIGRMRAQTLWTRTKHRRRNEPGFTRSEGANVPRERIFIPLKL